MEFETINKRLFKNLLKYDKEMVKHVFDTDNCDIDSSFLGFVDTYYYLSKIIPRRYTVIDFGCAYSPQAYYFRKHKKYFGIDPNTKENFNFENTTFLQMTIESYLESVKHPFFDEFFEKDCFAIANNVPSIEVNLIKNKFKNLYIFYTGS